MGLFDSLFGREKKVVPSPPEEELARIREETANERKILQVLKAETAALASEKQKLNQQIIELDEKVLLQSFALYEPMYVFATVDEYKRELETVREKQKNLLKKGWAVTGTRDWTVDGSAAKGRKMVSDMQKLLLRAFNSECEFVTWKVKYNNFDSCRKRIETAFTAIQKLGKTLSIEISREYFDLKIKELRLALEYQRAREVERERQRELRERQREEASLRKEIEESRRKTEKERAHYQNALNSARRQIEMARDIDRDTLLAKIQELEDKLGETEKNLADLDYREANQRAGYVYIISNIGSFGEDVYKIGMTRRLEPQERIDELSGASVPFKFDVHALIFTEDAPKLEAELHRAFEDRKVNMVNSRREFFKVPLAEIEAVVHQKFDKSVEFVQNADAEQFRESERIRAAQ